MQTTQLRCAEADRQDEDSTDLGPSCRPNLERQSKAVGLGARNEIAFVELSIRQRIYGVGLNTPKAQRFVEPRRGSHALHGV